VLEDNGPFGVVKVLVQAHTWSTLAQDAGKRRLANLERLLAQVLAVQLQEVKGVQEGLGFVPAMAEQVEGSHAVLIAAHHLTIDQAGPHLEVVHSSATSG
jgi:hypothetical protein